MAASLPQILEAHEHARQAAKSGGPARFEFFSPEQAEEIEAAAAQIIPTDQTPGAREARVIVFIDRALSTFDANRKETYRKGLKELAPGFSATVFPALLATRLQSPSIKLSKE